MASSRRGEMRSTSLRLVVRAAFLGTLLLFAAWLLPLAHSASSTILITSVYYDTYLTGEPDETFRLMNVSGAPVDLTNWTATDGPIRADKRPERGQSGRWCIPATELDWWPRLK
jgi:hypothetical protein